jgi:tRNA-Thr(GGU) m(6)t(6)A37 methyltransferase TsaA
VLEHRRFEALLAQGEALTDRASKGRKQLLESLMSELAVHERMEEQILYPALRSYSHARETLTEGFHEHDSAVAIVDELKAIPTDAVEWGVRFKALKESLQDHMDHEEQHLFPVARGVFSREELRALAEQMRALRARGRAAATHARVALQPIGTVRSPFTRTDQVPKGPGAEHEAEGVLDIRADLEEGLADIDGFSHLYVVWIFHQAAGAELTAHPPTDDRPHGVFATRSPQRPNPIGLTVVRLLGRDGHELRVKGIDMLDGTPILDIKPYLSSVPPEELRRGWLEDAGRRRQR